MVLLFSGRSLASTSSGLAAKASEAIADFFRNFLLLCMLRFIWLQIKEFFVIE
jgi:hypothetical protein